MPGVAPAEFWNQPVLTSDDAPARRRAARACHSKGRVIGDEAIVQGEFLVSADGATRGQFVRVDGPHRRIAMVVAEVRDGSGREDDVQVVADGEGVYILVRGCVGEQLMKLGGGDEVASEPDDHHVCLDARSREQPVTLKRRAPNFEARVCPRIARAVACGIHNPSQSHDKAPSSRR